MPYPEEFMRGIRELYTRLSIGPAVDAALTGTSQSLSDQLKMIAEGPDPRLLLELLGKQDYAELKLLGECAIQGGELRSQLREKWRDWCPNDPPGLFRASAFNPAGELVDT
jgi:hypothetical protein